MMKTVQLDRRTLLKGALCLAGAALSTQQGLASLVEVDGIGSPLAARREGEMDIHHIDTGRGNSTLVVAPDGTTLMIDAGAGTGAPGTMSVARPDETRRPGEWQARYALRHSGSTALDYMVVTHLHTDHLGDVNDHTPLAKDGSYRLTGVSDVDALMSIGTLIDRAWPDYGNTLPPSAPYLSNYLSYLKSRSASGHTVQKADVGSDQQLALKKHAAQYSTFKSRILSASGVVWTGKGHETQRIVPENPPFPAYENIYSIGLRLSYGRFSYYAGGDLSADTYDGQYPWMDTESPVARVAGRTEIAVANHHGYFDACGPEFVRDLDAQVYIIQSWDIGHPGPAQMQRMMGAWQNKATRDVFATGLHPQNALMNRRFSGQLKSQQGHVVVRVAPGGDSYRIFVLDSSDERNLITGTFGPYRSRA
jgi:beta-lactamase superfamily II metal-dependent hydrolase